MSIQTTQIKLLASALELNRSDIADIIALGGVTVSSYEVPRFMGQGETSALRGACLLMERDYRDRCYNRSALEQANPLYYFI